MVRFGTVMLEVGFSVIWVMICCSLLISSRMSFVWLFWKSFLVILSRFWLSRSVITLKSSLIFTFFIALMFISVWAMLVFRRLKIGSLSSVGTLLVITVILASMESFFFFSVRINSFNASILSGFG